MTITLEERLAGGLWGLLIGDAVGVPYEFHRPEHLPPIEQIDMRPPAGFRRAHGSVPPGTWSDDGAHALCLLSSLVECGRFDAKALAGRLLAWWEHGYLAVDANVFDIGIQTASALRAIRDGIEPLQAGPSGVRDNGNGSLMRVLPLALWHRGSDAELISDAMQQSRITHGHLRAQICCALYCIWARLELSGVEHAWAAATKIMRAELAVDSEATAVLESDIRPEREPDGGGTGYVVDCLHSARRALEERDFASVIRAAIALGHDTDTTACVAGGIAGVRYGVRAIPDAWRTGLRGREVAEPLLRKLFAHHEL